MKKYLLPLILLCILTNFSLAQTATSPAISKSDVVFLGNSITSVGKWQELIPNKVVINKGISGDLSTGVFYRLADALATNPSKIFLMIGVNDIKLGIPNSIIIANYQKITAYIKTKNTNSVLYLQSLLPVNQPMLAPVYARINNKTINNLNKKLLKLCKTEGLTFININKILGDAAGQLKPELTTDGLHLKPAAYQIWVNYLNSNNYL